MVIKLCCTGSGRKSELQADAKEDLGLPPTGALTSAVAKELSHGSVIKDCRPFPDPTGPAISSGSTGHSLCYGKDQHTTESSSRERDWIHFNSGSSPRCSFSATRAHTHTILGNFTRSHPQSLEGPAWDS